jgi:flagellar basal-body rod protein FlgF
MLRGLYTGASGMLAMDHRMDTVSNNLANADLIGYKRDVAVEKAFPQILLRRMSDDGVYKMPIGSTDVGPIVGKLGTGVEHNEVFTVFEQGSMKLTGNPFDLALQGLGFFTVDTPEGERYTRNGSFILGKEGYLLTKDGYMVQGEKGPIQIKKNNFKIDEDGNIFVNMKYQDDPNRLVSTEENMWEDYQKIDRLKLVNFDDTRYLQKMGNSFWKSTEFSGDAKIIEKGDRPRVIEQYLETANVNPVTEMVKLIEINRAYEANQKSIQTHDSLAGKLINEVVKI